jgi:hypothetical protein
VAHLSFGKLSWRLIFRLPSLVSCVGCLKLCSVESPDVSEPEVDLGSHRLRDLSFRVFDTFLAFPSALSSPGLFAITRAQNTPK